MHFFVKKAPQHFCNFANSGNPDRNGSRDISPDMDAFYASVEQRDDPALRGKPVIVGSPPTQRGVVCAASYEARRFGVRSAMPSVTAGRLCPDGIFVRPRMDVYREESRKIMAIVGQTGALVEQVSIDEAYLDVSSAVIPDEAGAFEADAALY